MKISKLKKFLENPDVQSLMNDDELAGLFSELEEAMAGYDLLSWKKITDEIPDDVAGAVSKLVSNIKAHRGVDFSALIGEV